MSTATPLPQSQGSPYHDEPHPQHPSQQHDDDRESLESTRKEHDYTIPVKPPSEYSGSVKSASVSGRSSRSARDRDPSRGRASPGRGGRDAGSGSRIGSSTGSGRSSLSPVKGVLRVGKHSRHSSPASPTGHIDGRGGRSTGSSDAVTSAGTGMSGNLLDAASVDSLERRFQKLIKDDSPDTSSIVGMAAVMSGGDAVAVKGASGSISAPKESVLEEEKQQIQREEQTEEPLEGASDDRIRNPFGRPLPREHVYSARNVLQSPPASNQKLVVQPVANTAIPVGPLASDQTDRHERAERYTSVTASTVPTTAASSEGGWLDRHLKSLGVKNPARNDVRVFQIEEGRELTADEIKAMRKKSKKNGVSTAAAAVLGQHDDFAGSEVPSKASGGGHGPADDATTAAHTTADDTVGTIGEETAGALLVGFTPQLQSKLLESHPAYVYQSKPWKHETKSDDIKKGRRSLKAEAEKAQDKRDRRLERAAERRRLDKESAKAQRKENERQRKRVEQAEAARSRKKSRVAEGSTEGGSSPSAYTGSAVGEASGTVHSHHTTASSKVRDSYQKVRSKHASRQVIGNLEVLDRDAMALERDIWMGIDEMMIDAMTTMGDNQTVASAEGLNSESGAVDASSSCYSQLSMRSHMSSRSTRSRAWDTVSKLGDKVKGEKTTASPPDDIGEVLLAKTALQGFISFFEEQNKVEVGESSSDNLDASLGNITDYTREDVVKATRNLSGHSVKRIRKQDDKTKRRQSKQKSVLEGLLELSSRNLLATESTQAVANLSDDTETHSLGSMDDLALGQVALDAFADVLIDASTSPESAGASVSARNPETTVAATRDFDVSPQKKAHLQGDQLTLFEVFRWSLRVNIDAKIRERGREERRLLKLEARDHRKRRTTSRATSKKRQLATPVIPVIPEEYEDDFASEMVEEEIERQVALAIQDVGHLDDNEEEEVKRGDVSLVEDISNTSSDDVVVDEAKARRQKLWKKGMKLERKRSERAVSLLSAAANLGLLSPSGEEDEEEEQLDEEVSVDLVDVEYTHPVKGQPQEAGDERHLSESTVGSEATDVVGNTSREKLESTLPFVREESEGRSSAYSSSVSMARPPQQQNADIPYSQMNLSGFFDETQGTAAAYASLERWESDEDGDSSVQEDAASAAFALISSAATPGARMPSARPLSSQSMSASEQSEDLPMSSTTATSTTTSFGPSRAGSGRSKASTRQSSGRSSGLASSRQSSGLDSIPEQEILARMSPKGTDRPRRTSMDSSVPDDDSSEKILDDLNKLQEEYDLDDEEEAIRPGAMSSYDAEIPRHDLQTIEERKSNSSSSDGGDLKRGTVLPRDDSSTVLDDSPEKILESLRDLSKRFGLDLVDDGRSSSNQKSSGASGQDVPSNALSEMRKSDSQISQHTQPSVRFADDEKSKGSEDSFIKWKKSVKTIYSETTGDSSAAEKRYEGAVLGAFRGLSDNTMSALSSTFSGDDAVLAATANNISLSSTSTSTAQSSALGPDIFINALMTKKDSGTTRSSSHPASSSNPTSSLFQSSGDNVTLSSKTQEKNTSGSGSAGKMIMEPVPGTESDPRSSDAVADDDRSSESIDEDKKRGRFDSARSKSAGISAEAHAAGEASFNKPMLAKKQNRDQPPARASRHRLLSDSSLSAPGGDEGMNSLFTSVKRSFAKGRKDRSESSNVKRGPSQEKSRSSGRSKY